jgi:hypothetical protein
MICDRCGRKTNHIYITEKHEKVCEKFCRGAGAYIRHLI